MQQNGATDLSRNCENSRLSIDPDCTISKESASEKYGLASPAIIEHRQCLKRFDIQRDHVEGEFVEIVRNVPSQLSADNVMRGRSPPTLPTR
jgi:hypothetical protein